MPFDSNIYSGIDNAAPSKLAQIFDPTVIQARQLKQAQMDQEQSQIARGNKLTELLNGGQAQDPVAMAGILAKNGFVDEAAKYQGIADAKKQRDEQALQRSLQLLAGAHGRIGAMGGSDDAIRQEYGAVGVAPEKIQSKIDWLNANVKPEQRASYFLDVSDPARITKREEAASKAKADADLANTRQEIKLPEGMRLNAKTGQPEWVPGYIQGKAKIAAAGANAGGVPMAVVQTDNGPIQVPTRGEGQARPIVDPATGQQAKPPKTGSTGVPAEVKRQIGGVIQLDKDLEALKAEMANFDPRGTDAVNLEKRARIQSIAKQAQLSAKEAAALGALSGPDMGLLEGILADPTSMRGVVNGKGGVLTQIAQAQAGNRRRIESIADQYGDEAVATLPEGLRPKKRGSASASSASSVGAKPKTLRYNPATGGFE